MDRNKISISTNENNIEMRCPKCYYYISLSQNPNNNNIIIKCQNCKIREMPLKEFYDTIKKNSKKTYNYCLKSFEINNLFINNKDKNDKFLCSECLYELKRAGKVNEEAYSYIKDLGKYCIIHKNEKNIFFCTKCNKNICKECKEENEHNNHSIIDIAKETKNKKEIEKFKNIIHEEEINIKNKKNLYNNILKNEYKKFEKIKTINEDILALKKIIYDIYESNTNNYEVHKYTNIITNNKKYGFHDKELNEIENLIDSINLNNNNSDLEDNNDFDEKKHSKSAIKLPKKIQSHTINLGDNKLKMNKNSDNYGTKSAIKYNKNRKNRKTSSFLFDTMNSDIQKRINMTSNISLNSKNNNEDFQILKKLFNSIIIMLYLGNNKVLISIFSQKNDLLLGEIKKGRNINKEELISLETLPVTKNFNEYINYMQLCEDGSILSCSDNQLVVFDLNDKIIDIKFSESIEKEERPIISCISVNDESVIALSGDNKLHYYMNLKDNEKIEKYLYKIEDYKIYSLHKLSNNYLILVGKKNNKNGLYLIIMKINKNEIKSLFDRELDVDEKEKIYIQEIFGNIAAVSISNNGLYLYDYTKNHIVYNIIGEDILAMKIEVLNDNKIYCYVVVANSNEAKNIEEMKLKQYLITRYYIKGTAEFAVSEKKSVNLSHKNKINDMLIINEKNGGNVKKLILLGDNDGNILYNYWQ